MIKVPATAAGVPAIEQLTAAGLNINVTLLFAVDRYECVIDAYISGLERRLQSHQPLAEIASVASFFVSRVDVEADPSLPIDSGLRGRIAIANARTAYAHYADRFSDERWMPLHAAGALPQRPLWASTATKDPAYSDVLYVEQLIAPGVINTMPEATLRAFADHGDATLAFDRHGADAAHILHRATDVGLDLDAITAQLERDGVRAFCDSYNKLLNASSPASMCAGRAQRPSDHDRASRLQRRAVGALRT